MNVLAAVGVAVLLYAAVRAVLRAAPLAGAGSPAFDEAIARRDDPVGPPPGLVRLERQVRDHRAGRPVAPEVEALLAELERS